MEVKDVRIWTAMITPFNAGGTDVDMDAFKSLLKRQEVAGNGVLICGSTGEGQSLSFKEKREIVEETMAMGLNVPVMVGIGGVNFEESRNLIEYCNEQGVDAYMLTTPSYTKPGVRGQIDWFTQLMDLAKRPCMIYNNPARSGVALEPEVVEEIGSHANAWSIKDSSGELSTFYKFSRASDQMELYSGEDLLIPFLRPFGVKGLVSVAGNIWPEVVRDFAIRCIDGEELSLDTLDWWQTIEALFSASNPIPTKALAYDLGLIGSADLRVPLNAGDLPSLEVMKEANELMTRDYSLAVASGA